MIDKIKHIANELGFAPFNYDTDTWKCFLHIQKASYIIEINIETKTNNFIKIENHNVDYVCRDKFDLENMYNSICDEFKFDIRKKKLNKLLNEK